MIIARNQVREALLAAFEAHGAALGSEITDEMAIPSYLQRGLISRAVFWRKLDFILRAANLRPGTRVFDFGCGTGILLQALSAEGRSVQGTDLHLELAREVVQRLGLSRVELLAADAWPAAVPDGEIETVIAANVLEHIDDRRALIATLASKLTPSGRLVISGPTENTLYRMGRRVVGFSGHYHVTTIRDILDDARAVGLRRVHLKRWPLPGPACLYQIAAFTR